MSIRMTALVTGLAVLLAARGIRLDGSRDVRVVSKEDTARGTAGGAQAGDSQT